MDCREVQRYLQDYIEKTLDPAVSHEVSRHLQTCAECTKELESLKRYFAYMHDIDTVRAPDDFLKRVRSRIEEERTGRRTVRDLFRFPRLRVPLELSAVTVVLVIAVVFVYQVTLKRPGQAVFEKKEITGAVSSEEYGIKSLAGKSRPEELGSKRKAVAESAKTAEAEHEETVYKGEKALPDHTVSSPGEAKRAVGSGTEESDRMSAGAVKQGLSEAALSETEAPPKMKAPVKPEAAGESGMIERTVVLVIPEQPEVEKKSLQPAAPREAEPSRNQEKYDAEMAEASRKSEEAEGSGTVQYSLRTKLSEDRYDIQKVRFRSLAARISGIVQAEGGKTVSIDYPEADGTNLVLTAEIPAERFDAFLKRLESFGTIHTPPVIKKEPAGTVRVRIELKTPSP